MSSGYRHRQVRPLYPEIPASVCDWELLPKDYCCQRTDLLDSGQVRPTRHIEAQQWIAVRTGLPDARERYLANAANSYWLPIRRARCAAGQPNSAA